MNGEEISPELLAIRGRFVESLPDRITLLQEANSDWCFDNHTAASKNAFEALYNLTHQLVGTAGSVGFPTLSIIARDLNIKLRHLKDQELTTLSESVRAELKHDFAELIAVAKNCLSAH